MHSYLQFKIFLSFTISLQTLCLSSQKSPPFLNLKFNTAHNVIPFLKLFAPTAYRPNFLLPLSTPSSNSFFNSFSHLTDTVYDDNYMTLTVNNTSPPCTYNSNQFLKFRQNVPTRSLDYATIDHLKSLKIGY